MIVCQQKLNIQHSDSLNFLFPCVSSPLPALHPPIHILYKLNYFKHFIIFSYILLTTFSFDILTEKKNVELLLNFQVVPMLDFRPLSFHKGPAGRV